MIEIDATSKQPLGMSAKVFLRDFWQKKPLLIRNAFPGFVSPIQPEDLAGLACEEMALSRIVSHDRARDAWALRSGPFAEEEFPGMPDHDWTLLVQDVDKWDVDVRGVLRHFDFLPRWRIDDVMVSFAATGGSVGAHVDQYDVFLLQAQGQRRWQIDTGSNPPLAFRDDVELKLLREFTPTHDWVLQPGDMLYLPPAKARPGQLNYATSGPGVPHHLYIELLSSMTGLKMIQVPYKGSLPALNDVAAGHVPLMMVDLGPALGPIQGGMVRPLGVSAARRIDVLKDVPPIGDTVPGFDAVGWFMMAAPGATPRPVVDKLHDELTRLLATPEVAGQIFKAGLLPMENRSVAGLQTFVHAEIARWGEVVRKAGIEGTF